MVDQITKMYEISIHALRKESDSMFLSDSVMIYISIHALRKESDQINHDGAPILGYFNPRSP